MNNYTLHCSELSFGWCQAEQSAEIANFSSGPQHLKKETTKTKFQIKYVAIRVIWKNFITYNDFLF